MVLAGDGLNWGAAGVENGGPLKYACAFHKHVQACTGTYADAGPYGMRISSEAVKEQRAIKFGPQLTRCGCVSSPSIDSA